MNAYPVKHGRLLRSDNTISPPLSTRTYKHLVQIPNFPQLCTLWPWTPNLKGNHVLGRFFRTKRRYSGSRTDLRTKPASVGEASRNNDKSWPTTPLSTRHRSRLSRRQVHRPRLTKIMEFFAVGGPSTAPSPAAALPATPTTFQPTKRKSSTSGWSDLSTSKDSDSSDSSSTSSDQDNQHTAVTPAEPPPDASNRARKRRPRPPAMKGENCRLSVREFVGMLRSLGVRGSGGK